MTSPPVRVLIAEDQAMVRAGFRALIDAEHDLEVVGEAADGHDAVALAKGLAPDLVLMDVRMPLLDGIQATQRITTEPALSETRVLVLTTFELDEYVFSALRAGASGFLLKGGEPAELLTAIRLVAAGDALLAPQVTRRVIEAFAETGSPPAPPPGLAELTVREHEVLALLADGASNREIADRLYLSPLTAKTHVSRILAKLEARDRVQAAVIAHRAGLDGSAPTRR